MKDERLWILTSLGAISVVATAAVPLLLPYVGALVIAVASWYLTTFSACSSLPPELEPIADQLDALRSKKEKSDDLKEELKAKQSEGLGGIALGKLKGFFVTQRTVEDIERELARIDGAIDAEIERLPTGDEFREGIKKLKEDGKELSERIQKLEEGSAGSMKLALRSAVPGLPPSSTRIIGLTAFSSNLDRALERAVPWIDRKSEQLDKIAASVKPLRSDVGAARKALPIAASPRSTLKAVGRAIEALESASENLDAFLTELLVDGFQDGFREIRDLAEFLETQPEISVLVTRDPKHDGPTLVVQAELELDAFLFGEIRRGDVLVVELPRGFRLTSPVKLAPSKTIKVAISGNRAGSCVVALEIRQCSGTRKDSIKLSIDQPIQVDDVCGSGELRIWNVNQSQGVVIPVTTVVR